MATQLFTREEVAERNTKENATIIIDNEVYEVYDFFLDHPGGIEVLMDNAGKDASQCFADVGHSDEAIEWRKQFKIGEVVESERWEKAKRPPPPFTIIEKEPFSILNMLAAAGPPIMLTIAAVLLYRYLFQ